MTVAENAGFDYPRRHHGEPGSRKVLFIHGFTGAPATMDPQIEAAVRAGYDVYAPLLRGHGTTLEDMLPTRYEDYLDDARHALDDLAAGESQVALVGISMGGTLAIDLGLSDPRVERMVLINPLVLPPAESYMELLDQLLAAGMEVAPAVGSDIADPEVKEASYDGAPVRAAKSLFMNTARIAPRVSGLAMPILLFNSLQDHVVPVESGVYLAENAVSVRRVALERSYHVATLDYDKELITEAMLKFLAS
ncbi:MAG: alpha/beta fold hydrolase [Nitrospiraceae bacterium]|nr:alpha/beta fold hydrolase [Nitrospiraceae bacterium]MDA8261820.1 alpha/beta fold hydrolase [Actinomycetota bacterium]